MAILVDASTRVLIQGITGREGRGCARLMCGYGTQVVAGCTPGRGGEEVDGIPMYDTVAAAIEGQGKLDATVISAPAPKVKGAALGVIGAGAPLTVLLADRVPVWMFLRSCAPRNAPAPTFWAPTPWASFRWGREYWA